MTKRVRCINLPWLHDNIVGMKRSLEKLDAPRKLAKLKSGHPGCIRLAMAVKDDTSRRAPRGLPSNWYNPDWWGTLSDLERTLLEAGPEKPIPELVSTFRLCTCLSV